MIYPKKQPDEYLFFGSRAETEGETVSSVQDRATEEEEDMLRRDVEESNSYPGLRA
jgi:hypothetical protein